MIKHTHFNHEHPENQNIKITNKKEPYVKILKDNKWEYQDRKNTISHLIENQHLKINDQEVEECVEKKCTNFQKENIDRCNEVRKYSNTELVKISILYSQHVKLIKTNYGVISWKFVQKDIEKITELLTARGCIRSAIQINE